MLRTLADQHDPRPVVLLYGSKEWDVITFREELEALNVPIAKYHSERYSFV